MKNTPLPPRAMPLLALAGMLVPMAIYAFVNRGDAVAMRGVAIPAATDIAFALGVLALLGSRVPVALKLLLTAIAVADDLGAIVIIAVWYTNDLSLLSLAIAGAAFAGLLLINRLGVVRPAVAGQGRQPPMHSAAARPKTRVCGVRRRASCSTGRSTAPSIASHRAATRSRCSTASSASRARFT